MEINMTNIKFIDEINQHGQQTTPQVTKKKTMGKLMVNDPHQFFPQKHKNKELKVQSEMVCNNYTNFML
jgi:hypothetical protein